MAIAKATVHCAVHAARPRVMLLPRALCLRDGARQQLIKVLGVLLANGAIDGLLSRLIITTVGNGINPLVPAQATTIVYISSCKTPRNGKTQTE